MIGPRSDSAGMRVWIAAAPVDMRKSFDGLAEVVRVSTHSKLTHFVPSRIDPPDRERVNKMIALL